MLQDSGLFDRFSLFQGISLESLRRLAEASRQQRVAAGGLLWHQGASYDNLYLLIDGVVSMEMQDAGGKSIVVEILQAPAALALGVLFARDPELPATARAKTDATCARIARDDLYAWATGDPVLLRNLLREVSEVVLMLGRRLSFMSFRSIRSKLAHFLADQPMKPGNVVVLPRSIEELASYFGVARPALSKVLLAMAEEGIIEHRGRRLRVLDLDALLRLAD